MTRNALRRCSVLVVSALAITTSCSGHGEAHSERSSAAADLDARTESSASSGPTRPAAADPSPDHLETTDLRPEPEGAVAGAAAPAVPTSLTIASVGIDVPLDELGLGADGAVEAPTDFERAGWYTGSVEPGQLGPAVLAGHVDSTTGPAAFHGLADVLPGDEIVVHRADGTALTFRVTGVEQQTKEFLPPDVLHGPRHRPELRVVTCGGVFDRATGHYQDNVVVTAVLV